ncbi:MAG: hypothetical protein ACJ8FY_08465 [Gemmataceae bacterium]
MFDPYEKWLRIPKDERPVTHYQLLGVDPEEDDADAIIQAAKKQKSRVMAHQDGPNGKAVNRLVKEINQAKATLLDEDKRADYDRRLSKLSSKNGEYVDDDWDDDEEDAPVRGRRSRAQANPPWLWPVMGAAAVLVVAGIVAGVVLSPSKKAQEPTKKEEVAQTTPKEKEPDPVVPVAKEEKPAPKPDKPAEVKPAAPPPQAAPPPATAPAPAPQPAPPPPPPPAKFVKMKVPDSTAQAKAEETLKNAYKADYAKEKPDDKLALAAKFLQPGRENRKDPAEWFVMLREARDLAVQAGRPRLAVEAVKEIDKWFIIEPHRMKIDVLTAVNDSVKEDAKEVIKEAAARIIASVALGQVNAALDDNNFDAALKLIALADSAARKPKQFTKEKSDEKPEEKKEEKRKEKADDKAKDKDEEKPDEMPKEKNKDETLARIEARKAEVEAYRKDYQTFQEAQSKLKQTPDDTAANLIVGKYLCYFHGKWDEGLPLLAKSADPVIKPVVLKELGKPAKFKDQADLAEDWSALSNKEEGRKQNNVAMHALTWFASADQQAKPEDKSKLAERIKEVKKKGPVHLPRLLPGSFYGRANAEERTILLREGGGTMRSEEAVAQGLEWLAQHQYHRKNRGLWATDTFNQAGQCNCANPGEKHDIAGTALGLLPFLGAGETHRSGKYKEVVERGLKYLLSKQKKDGNYDDNNYENALATIAVCEACALARDRDLARSAQAAVLYIATTQNADGSWGYGKGSAGDLSVTGWQFSALKSAVYAGLRVPKGVIARTSNFLDKVADSSGLGYGYNSPSAVRTTSATGLLCREYLGWGPDNARLTKGINNLLQSANFPTRESPSLYFVCYTTQVMHHLGDKPWETWNRAFRDLLIDLQDQGKISALEHQKGSWAPSPGEYDKQGGRLLYTSLALITLETYYYHVPLYGYGEALWQE